MSPPQIAAALLADTDAGEPVQAPVPVLAPVQSIAGAAGLPRISALAAHLLNRAYAWPEPFLFTLARGQYALRWRADTASDTLSRVYGFRFGSTQGWLALDPLGERELIGAAASDAVPADVRDALMADALAPVLDALETATRQRVEFDVVPATLKSDDVARALDVLRFRVTRSGAGAAWHCDGALRFDDARYLALACPRDPSPPVLANDDFAGLPVTLRFTFGSTLLTVAELSSLALGDIIGIERWQSAGAALSCVATTHDERVTLTGRIMGARIVIETIEENIVTPSPPAPAAAASASPDGASPLTSAPGSGSSPGNTNTDANADAAHAASPALTQVDALEMRVTFELGERSIALRELKTMKAGYVIELDEPLNQSAVLIRANGAVVGQGHLIAVGNRLGVRVSRLAETSDG